MGSDAILGYILSRFKSISAALTMHGSSFRDIEL